MSDLPALPLSEQQLEFIVEQLAFQDTNLIDIQNKYEQFFKVPLGGELLLIVRKSLKDLIAEKRSDLYSQTDSIPIANAFPRLALAQSRVEYLAKNEKIMRTVRRLDENTGREFMEDIKEIDDDRLHKWATFAQNEEYLAKKLLVELIVKGVDKAKMPVSGFKPIRVSSGLEEEDA